ncbi:MAG: hypothetical protein ACLQU4_04090 [Limisphaerales bacterium]
MRIALTTLTVSAAILTALLAGSRDVCHAQDQSETTLVEMSSIPTNGTFWSMKGCLPPSPFDPLPQLQLYTDGTPGNYDPNWPATLWMGSLSNYGVTDQLRLCPTTYEQLPIQNQGIPGTANIAWDFGAYTVPPLTGSYGFNYWLFSFPADNNDGRAATLTRPDMTGSFRRCS